MIITRTPYRVSFLGGGTDFPAYYREHGGTVLSATINRYSHIVVRDLPPYFDYKYRLRYFKTEEISELHEIQHPSIRECLRFTEYKKGIEILHTGDVPAMSGIGSSSSFTVGLLQALYGLQGQMVTKRKLAFDAIHIEQNLIRENVGSQDQCAAAFGGLNRIDFGPGDRILVNPVIMKAESYAYLQASLLFVFSGISRVSSDMIQEQIRGIKSHKTDLEALKELTEEGVALLSGPPASLNAFGKLLNEAWQIKKSLSSRISTSITDVLYDAAIKAGALGGKVCGAGGGGFMAFFVPPERRESVCTALSGALIVPIRLETLGAHVIFYTQPERESREPLAAAKPPGSREAFGFGRCSHTASGADEL